MMQVSLDSSLQEEDIYRLFRDYGKIDSIRLMRSKTTNLCLGYGFITFIEIQAHPLAMQLYGRLLLGRRLKIGLANPRTVSPVSAKVVALMKEFDRAHLKTKDSQKSTAQVHFSYWTLQRNVLITEETVRGIFSHFGDVDDITIKKSCIDNHSQHGYGFVYFYLNDDGVDAAIRATSMIRQIVINGILYDSCLTRSLEAALHSSSSKTVAPPLRGMERIEIPLHHLNYHHGHIVRPQQHPPPNLVDYYSGLGHRGERSVAKPQILFSEDTVQRFRSRARNIPVSPDRFSSSTILKTFSF